LNINFKKVKTPIEDYYILKGFESFRHYYITSITYVSPEKVL